MRRSPARTHPAMSQGFLPWEGAGDGVGVCAGLGAWAGFAGVAGCCLGCRGGGVAMVCMGVGVLEVV